MRAREAHQRALVQLAALLDDTFPARSVVFTAGILWEDCPRDHDVVPARKSSERGRGMGASIVATTGVAGVARCGVNDVARR